MPRKTKQRKEQKNKVIRVRGEWFEELLKQIPNFSLPIKSIQELKRTTSGKLKYIKFRK